MDRRFGWIVLAIGCGGGGGGPGPASDVVLYDVTAAVFDGRPIDHPLLPFPVGATWRYRAETADGVEEIAIEVVPDAKTIQGVAATVVRDTVTLDGVVTEDTRDWYAQDVDGAVWYLGEDTCEYVDGECASTVGSWEWGVDGALPGVAMPAHPAVDGVRYYQEFLEGEAEDVGEVVAVDLAVSVAAGDFDGCVRTHDTSTLDPDLDEFKYFCPGVGQVRTEEPDQDEELVEYAMP